MWKQNNIDLGKVKQKTSVTVKFELEEEFKDSFEVNGMKSSCGCTTPTFNKREGIIEAVYKSAEVPRQSVHKGGYTTSKKIVVDSNTGEHTLTFNVRVIL
jgi:hypothetical protein